MKWIYKYIPGYVSVRVECADTGRMMTKCAKECIHIFNIIRIDDITIEMCVFTYQYSEFEQIIVNLRGNIKVLYSTGISQLINKIKRRKFFAAGFCMFAAIVLLSCSFVTDISIAGNETVSDDTIIRLLEQEGFKKGVLVYNINKKQIQQNIIKNYDKLAWIWIDLDGTKASVRVKERKPEPEELPKDVYTNCIAAEDGVVIEIMPRFGRQTVHTGDVVKKGDLLISGISETKTGQVRYMRADGIVKARTWYSAEGEYSHKACKRYLTGNSKNMYNINIGNFDLPVFKRNIEYEKYDVSKTTKKFCPILNLSFTIVTYCEIIEENVTISDEEVVSKAKKVLESRLESQLADKVSLEIVDKTCVYEVNSSGNLDVKVTFECTEDIARQKQLDYGGK